MQTQFTPAVMMLPVEAISLPSNRQRSLDEGVQKHIDELAQDIAKDGLLHAVAISRNNELVAGWCRLHAIGKLDKPYKYASADVAPGFVPCVVIHHTDEESLHRVELMENLRRKALSVVDQAKAIAALHKSLQKEANVERLETWTEKDTGAALDNLRGDARHPAVAEREVAESLLLDGFGDDPDIAKAATRKEAVKIAKKKLETQLMASLGELAPRVESSDYTIHNGDCLNILPSLADESFHGIITDPPYGVDADTFGEQTSAEGHEYEDTEANAFSIAHTIFKEGFRLCKPGAHLYLFCDPRLWDKLRTIAGTHGWDIFATPLIWSKPGLGHAPQPGYFSRRYECILFAQKGRSRKLQKTRGDVLEFPPVKDKIHAAQKPVELLKELMSLSFFPGEHILDPCAGSGSVFTAAHQVKIRATGIELSEKYANICKQVIGELK